MDFTDLPNWPATDWQEFARWLDDLDFSSGNAHVAGVATEKGMYAVVVTPKTNNGTAIRRDEAGVAAQQ